MSVTLKHYCGLDSEINRNQSNRRCWRTLKDALFESLLISDKNPQTRLHFRSMPEIERERKRQKDYGQWVIHPYSSFRLYIELVMIVIFFFHLMNTPWDMLINVIYNEHVDPGLSVIFIIVCVCGVLDMGLTFYTGYLDERTMEVVLNKSKIRRLYLRSWLLLFDIIATAPIEIIISNLRSYNIYYTRWLLLLCITRLFRIPTFVLYMNNAADLWHISRNVYKCIRYVVFAILVVSWVGCMTAVVSMFAYIYHPERLHLNWVIQAEIDHDILFIDLIISIVFRATSTLIGVKHGKFPNVNPEDKLCASISFFVGFFIMAFFLVLILQILMDNSLPEISNYKFLNQLHHYMGTIRLPANLKGKIIEFYRYRFINNSRYDNDTMNMLSESLENEIKMFKYRSVILKAHITSDMPLNIIQNMLNKVEVEYFMTGDTIIRCGQIGTSMYFLVTGTVAIYTHFGVEICHLYDGTYFGEIALILNEHAIATAIALEPCEVCKLSRSDFYSCVNRDSDIFKRLFEKAKERSKSIDILNAMHRSKMIELERLWSRNPEEQFVDETQKGFYYPAP